MCRRSPVWRRRPVCRSRSHTHRMRPRLLVTSLVTGMVTSLACSVLACAHPAPPAAPRAVAPSIATPSGELANALVSGLSVELELRVGAATVGSCRIAYDVWDELYLVTVA